ncbi:hypothetical protein Trydic_g58 [Trypoxylus dichotomus]
MIDLNLKLAIIGTWADLDQTGGADSVVEYQSRSVEDGPISSPPGIYWLPQDIILRVELSFGLIYMRPLCQYAVQCNTQMHSMGEVSHSRLSLAVA